MSLTTIKLQRSTRVQLQRARQPNETYDALLRRLLQKQTDLTTAFRKSAAQDRELLAEWEHTSWDV